MIVNEMRQLSTRDQMTQKLTTISHRTAFNNKQRPYRIISYKRSRNDINACSIKHSRSRFDTAEGPESQIGIKDSL